MKLVDAVVDKVERILSFGGLKKDGAVLVLSSLSLLVSLLGSLDLPFDVAWVAIVLCGVPIVAEAIIGLVTAFDIKADLLVAMALIASICIGEYFAAGEVAFIMQLGELLEKLTIAKAEAGIEKLVRLTPRIARVMRDGKDVEIPADQVQVGEHLRVLPGETIPVDGVIVSGTTSINQSVMTGESLPVDKFPGDKVCSGTVNQYGAFEMESEKVGEDSSIQRMIRLVQSADAGKARIVRLADRWATWIVVASLVIAGLTWLISGELIRAVTVLVVFCPCSFVIATPAAIMAAIGNATRHGFLVRQGDALERLARVCKITLDKTGTLTHGTPNVVGVKAVDDVTEKEVFAFAAAAERYSEHPLGKAIVSGYLAEEKAELPQTEEFSMKAGQGIQAMVHGHRVAVGNAHYLTTETGTEPPSADEFLKTGATVIYVAVDGKTVGYLALADTVRAESEGMIRDLKQQKVEPVLLTGDHEAAATAMGKVLKIEDIHSECLPEDKLRHIETYQTQGAEVCMIGDGINDAPALKKANVGIAMGGIGSDIAMEAADMVLVNDDLKELPHLLALARRMMGTIKLNLSFSMALNCLAIALAVTGLLGPVFGALVHNAGSVAVIVNSTLLLGWKRA